MPCDDGPTLRCRGDKNKAKAAVSTVHTPATPAASDNSCHHYDYRRKETVKLDEDANNLSQPFRFQHLFLRSADGLVPVGRLPRLRSQAPTARALHRECGIQTPFKPTESHSVSPFALFCADRLHTI
jgi:hypothetical protein